MNEVRQICELALEAPAPPLPTAAEALGLARRSARRTRLAVAGSVAGAGVAVIATVAAAAVLFSPAAPAASQRGTPTESTTAVQPPLPAAPSVDQAHEHSPVIAAALVAAVPAGFQTRVDSNSADGRPASTWRIENGPAYISTTQVLVSSGPRLGQVLAILYGDGQPAVTGDLCAPDVTATFTRVSGAPSATCEVVVVNGVTIRVSTGPTELGGQSVSAIRVLEGGYLQILAQVAVPVFGPDDNLPPDAVNPPVSGGDAAAPLVAPPLTVAQAAQLAADPALLP